MTDTTERLLQMILEELKEQKGNTDQQTVKKRGSYGNPDNYVQYTTPEERAHLSKLLDPLKFALMENTKNLNKLSEEREQASKDQEQLNLRLQTLTNAIKDGTVLEEVKAVLLDEQRDIYLKKEELAKKFFEMNREEEKMREKVEDKGQNLRFLELEFDKLHKLSEDKIDTMFKTIDSNFRFMGGMFNSSPLYRVLDAMISGKDPEKLLAAGALKAFGHNISKVLSPLNLFVVGISMVSHHVKESIGALDAASVSFMKMTGMVEGTVGRLMDGWKGVRTLNVSLQEYSTALESYIDNFSGFSKLTADSQIDFAQLGAVAQRLGVSLQSSAKIFSFFKDAMGQTIEQAKKGFANLLGIADKFGESFSKITDEFVQSIPVLAKWGAQTENVFKQVEALRKSLNIATQDVMELAGQYNTFDSAAQHVGRLNAILGGPYLNTLNLLNQNEAQRVETIFRGVQASRKNWQALNQFEKQAIATAAGITNMDTAAKIFGGSISDLNKYLNTNSIEQKEMNERSARAATIGDRMKTVFQSLVIAAEPLVNILQTVVGWIQKLSETTGVFTIPILLTMVGLTKGLVGWFSGLPGAIGRSIASMIGWGNASAAAKAKDAAATDILAASNAANAAAVAGTGTAAAGATVPTATFFSVLKTGTAGASAFAANLLVVGAAIAGVIVLVGAATAIVEGLIDAFTDTPLEEFRQEIIDPLKTAPASFANNLRAIDSLMTNLSKNAGAFNLLNKDNITALGEAFQKAQGISGNFVESFSNFAGAIIKPFASNNIEKTFNQTIMPEDKKDQAAMVLEKMDTIIKLLSSTGTSANPTTKLGAGKQANLSVNIDRDVLANVIISVIEDRWAVRGGGS